MASFSEEITGNSENMLREIQTERMMYHINSSSETKKAIDRMKKGVDEITKAMESARNIVYEKKMTADEMKINLSEKKGKIKKMQQDLEHIRKRVESSSKKALNLETEKDKIKDAIEKIKEASQGLDPKYLEQSQNELMNTFVKVASDAEKAESDLNAEKRREAVTVKKIQGAEIDFNKLETQTLDKINDVETMASNVSTTTEHIIRTYDEIMVVSKDLLKSAISTKEGLKREIENRTEQGQPHQEFNENRVAI